MQFLPTLARALLKQKGQNKLTIISWNRKQLSLH